MNPARSLLRCAGSLIVLASSSEALAGTLFVDGSHPACSDLTGTPYCTIQAAQNAAAPGDQIEVAAGVYAEHLQISRWVKIRGAGPGATVLDGTDSGVPVTTGGNQLWLEALAIVNGNGPSFGGGIVHRFNFLYLKHVSVRNNHSAIGGGGLFSSFGDLLVEDSEFLDNVSQAQGGGIYVAGTRFATLQNCLIEGNRTSSTGAGGGIRVDNSFLSIRNSTIRQNVSVTNGGGISGSGLTIEGSSIVGNSCLPAQCGGGGLQIGSGTVRNTTIVGNAAGYGGGVIVSGADELRLNNVTIAANAAGIQGGGIWFATGVSASVGNTLIGDNSAPSSPDCLGQFASTGYNLIETTAGCSITGDTTGHIHGLDPQLLPLGDYGGRTPTLALAATSPAVDQANPGTFGQDPLACEFADQRGVTRPRGPRCDIGAFEHNSVFSDGFESGDTSSWSDTEP